MGKILILKLVIYSEEELNDNYTLKNIYDASQ